MIFLLKARKTLRHLKGVSRLQTLTKGDFGKKQASNTLINIQQWSKIQAQIRTRRQRMVEDGGIRQKKLENQLKLETKLHDLEVKHNVFRFQIHKYSITHMFFRCGNSILFMSKSILNFIEC